MKNRFGYTGMNLERIILTTLVLTMVIVLSGCKAGDQLGEQFERAINQITGLPDRIARGIISLFGSIGDVGEALTGMIRDMIGNMTGE